MLLKIENLFHLISGCQITVCRDDTFTIHKHKIFNPIKKKPEFLMFKTLIISQQCKLLSRIQCQAHLVFFDRKHKRPPVLKATEPQKSKMLFS